MSSMMLIGALWVATRPYYGVVHDARFYIVEALRQLEPARFADDLYFRFGSQDQFTIFSKLYAPIVTAIGVANGSILMTLAGQALFLAGLIVFAHAVLRPRRVALLATVGAIVLPSLYLIFVRYGEPFATPRLFAEGLSLLALALLLRMRIVPALLLLAFSTAVHPLETLPALVLALVYLAFGRPLWWLVICGGAATAIGFALLGVPPFANLGAFYDPQWFAIVTIRNSQNFVGGWTAVDDMRVAGIFALAVIALSLAEAQERRVLAAVLVVSFGGILCTFIGADLIHDVFVTEIQTWRGLWLLTLVANLFAVPSFLRLWSRREQFGCAAESLALALALSLLTVFVPPLIVAAAPLMVVTALVVLWQIHADRGAKIASFLCLPVIALALVVALLLLYKIAINGFFRVWPEELRPGLYALGLTVAMLSLVVVVVRDVGSRWCWPLAGVAALFALALLGWDARTPWTRFAESAETPPPSLMAMLPPSGEVYWEGGLEAMWFLLRRPEYFSCDQGTGALFFRGTALAYEHRRKSLLHLNTLDFDSTTQCQGSSKDSPIRMRKDLADVCALEPALDVLVLTRPINDIEARVWVPSVPFREIRVVDGRRTIYQSDRFYVYSCAAQRQPPREDGGL